MMTRSTHTAAAVVENLRSSETGYKGGSFSRAPGKSLRTAPAVVEQKGLSIKLRTRKMFQKKSRAAQSAQILRLGVGILLLSTTNATISGMIQASRKEKVVKDFTWLLNTHSDTPKTETDTLVSRFENQYFHYKRKGADFLDGLVGLTDAINKVFRKSGKGDRYVVHNVQRDIVRQLYKLVFSKEMLDFFYMSVPKATRLPYLQLIYQLLNLAGNFNYTGMDMAPNKFTQLLEYEVLDKLSKQTKLLKMKEFWLDLVYASTKYDIERSGSYRDIGIQESLKNSQAFAMCILGKTGCLGRNWPRPTVDQYAVKFAPLGQWDLKSKSQPRPSRLSLFSRRVSSLVNRNVPKDPRHDSLRAAVAFCQKAMGGRRRLMERLNAGCPPKRS